MKNYRADTIIFESSGMAYRESKNTSERMDILDQVSRARDIIRDIIGPNINIYNVIVFADDNTRIIDNMNHENIKVVHMDLLSFLFQNQTNRKPENKEIESRLLKAKTSERKYDCYDISMVKSDFIQAINNDITAMGKTLKYRQNFNLIEKEINLIKSQIRKQVRKYKFAKSDRKMILSFYEERLNTDRENLRPYLQELNPETINDVIIHLNRVKQML